MPSKKTAKDNGHKKAETSATPRAELSDALKKIANHRKEIVQLVNAFPTDDRIDARALRNLARRCLQWWEMQHEILMPLLYEDEDEAEQPKLVELEVQQDLAKLLLIDIGYHRQPEYIAAAKLKNLLKVLKDLFKNEEIIDSKLKEREAAIAKYDIASEIEEYFEMRGDEPMGAPSLRYLPFELSRRRARERSAEERRPSHREDDYRRSSRFRREDEIDEDDRPNGGRRGRDDPRYS